MTFVTYLALVVAIWLSVRWMVRRHPLNRSKVFVCCVNMALGIGLMARSQAPWVYLGLWMAAVGGGYLLVWWLHPALRAKGA